MLSFLIWAPALGALLIAFSPFKLTSGQTRDLALTVSGASLLWTIWLFTQFDITNAGFSDARVHIVATDARARLRPGLRRAGPDDGCAQQPANLDCDLQQLAQYRATPVFLLAHAAGERRGVAGAFLAQKFTVVFPLV